ncbi:hypothetical protein JKF63_06859 [Porcisia hertigi]|uniref:Uncharacterized protein n=1 Tax=Porcisia hertigi TaxID=2761500 RepID=A0A836LJ93_9TRYP|nr:hypothetical protein JKF63_06859 [Porcisia hertigi]
MVGDVTPDFIAVIITHCSSEPHYPLLSLLKEAIWRPIRQRRRLHIEEVKGIFDDFMVRMNDASRAQEMYLQFRAMELLLYPHVPRVFAPSSGEHASLVDELTLDVDENGVPRRMHDLVEAAAEVVRQQLSSDAREKKCTSSATSSAASIDNNC